MAGIDHLKDIYDDKGLKFIQKLFSSDVYITEKIDGARFAFEWNGNNLEFYKRNPKRPISMVDRTVMKYYEPAISHIQSLNTSKFDKGIRYGFEYFATTNPGTITYDKKPKNNLILTDISKGGSLVTDIDKLERIAKKLNVDPPPVIFDGRLSSEKQEQLIDFLETPWEDLYDKFKTQSFTAYIISIVNPKLKRTALNMDLNKGIEGIVFSFNDGKSYINAKVVDPLYTQKARQSARNRYTDEKKKENELTKEFMREVIGFIKSYDISTINLEQDSKNKRYVELLSKLFKRFYQKNKSEIKKLPSSSLSDYDNEMLDVNYNFIFDEELEKIIRSDDRAKFGYKAYLSAFGKTRKRGNRVLDSNMVSNVNSLVNTMRSLSESFDTVYAHLLSLYKR